MLTFLLIHADNNRTVIRNVNEPWVVHRFGYKLTQSSHAMPLSSLSNIHDPLMRFFHAKALPLTTIDSACTVVKKDVGILSFVTEEEYPLVYQLAILVR